MNTQTRKQINKRFIFIANELMLRFPDLDLRFTLSTGEQALRYKAAAVSGNIYDLTLCDRNPEEALYEAIFNIKELAHLYDA